MKKLFIYLFLIVGLATFMIISILIINNHNNSYYHRDYEYVEIPKTYKTGRMKKTSLNVYSTYYGKINRINNEIKVIEVNKSNVLNCKIGSIINSAKDIFINNEENNYCKGRVIDVNDLNDCYQIKIDIIDNYECDFVIPDIDAKNLNFLLKKVINYQVFVNDIFFNIEFNDYEYSKSNQSYSLKSNFNDFNDLIVDGINLQLRVKEKEYQNVICIEPKLAKYITDDYFVVLDKVTQDNELEEVRYKIIDYSLGLIAIDANKISDDEFVIYNKYYEVKNGKE